jgi:hypothetical protein
MVVLVYSCWYVLLDALIVNIRLLVRYCPRSGVLALRVNQKGSH